MDINFLQAGRYKGIKKGIVALDLINRQFNLREPAGAGTSRARALHGRGHAAGAGTARARAPHGRGHATGAGVLSVVSLTTSQFGKSSTE